MLLLLLPPRRGDDADADADDDDDDADEVDEVDDVTVGRSSVESVQRLPLNS